MNGDDVIIYIESKCGALEEAFIEQHKEEFMEFVESEMNCEGDIQHEQVSN